MKAQLARRFILVLLLMICPSPLLAKGALNAEAQKHFDAGLAYAEDPSGAKWEEALHEFRAAYAASPTWKLMNNIGLCALHLERDGEAIAAYKLYLANGGESDFTPKQRIQMERDIAMLSATLVTVNLEIEPREALIIDERRNSKGELLVNQYPVTNGKASLGIHPGFHKFTIQAPNHETTEWSVNAEPASIHQHQFKLEPEKKTLDNAVVESVNPAARSVTVSEPPVRPTSPTPTAVYIGLAATGVFAVAATVTGVVTMSKAKEFDNTSDKTERHRIAESGKTYSLLTDIGVGAAVLSAGVTTYLYLSSPKHPVATEAKQSRFTFAPTASPNGAGISLSGKF